ncbi:hypothetical protein HJC99_03050 [Candidatus Saccharibacteria bacterium]|nr:hypothetical protein [Candidatus Saccharibacteria bacterium]
MNSNARSKISAPAQKRTILNSTIAFVLAGLIVTTLHEISHLVAALILGATQATIYPNFVVTPDATSHAHDIISLATGPLFKSRIRFASHLVAQKLALIDVSYWV